MKNYHWKCKAFFEIPINQCYVSQLSNKWNHINHSFLVSPHTFSRPKKGLVARKYNGLLFRPDCIRRLVFMARIGRKYCGVACAANMHIALNV